MSAAHKSAAFKFQFLFPQSYNGRFCEVDEIRSIIQIEVYIKNKNNGALWKVQCPVRCDKREINLNLKNLPLGRHKVEMRCIRKYPKYM